MADKSNSGAKESWLTICVRIVYLLFVSILTVIGTVALFVIATEHDIIIPVLVLLFAITGILLLVLLRLLFSPRFRRPTIFTLLCLATLVALFYAEEDWRGKHAWNRCQSEWAAKGETPDWQSVVPPAVPDDQNFALAPVVASSYSQLLDEHGHEKHPQDTNIINRLAMDVYGGHYDESTDSGNWSRQTRVDLAGWQSFYRNLATKTNFFPVPPQPHSPPADVLLALSPFNATIEDLRQAVKLSESRFPLNYDNPDPEIIMLPHLGRLKMCGQVLRLRSLAELQNNQSDLALADVQLLFRLNDSIRSEPFLISHLVRISVLQIALQPAWEGLADRRWSDSQLAALDAMLAKLNYARDYQMAMKGELGLGERYLDFLHQGPKVIHPLFNASDDGKQAETSVSAGILSWIPAGWIYQNQVNFANIMLKYFLPVADVDLMTISPLAEQRAVNALTADTKHFIPYKLWERFTVSAVGRAGDKFARAQAFTDLARVAIALERYRLVHGAYPATLDALSLEFLAEIPHDVIDGQPLHYRLESNGQFTLYSIGWNGRDDGGAIILKKGSTPQVDYDEGDWVWRYPAK